MKVGFAQIDTTVGDLPGNTRRIITAYEEAVRLGADLVLTPELALPGYPPQDLLFKSRFVPENIEALGELERRIGDVPLLVGFVDRNNEGAGRPFRNAAALLKRGAEPVHFHKCRLPTYDVFDEDRYFEPAAEPGLATIEGRRIGVTICEDIWHDDYLYRRLYRNDPVDWLTGQGAEAILNLSASPFYLGKPRKRHAMLTRLAAGHRVPIAYCNLVGGNDQLIFDGNSMLIDARGNPVRTLPAFEEGVTVVDLFSPGSTKEPLLPSDPEDLFHALSLGLRDYLYKCGFRSVVLGLSGGIDSAVTAAIAEHAVGRENVLGVALPSRYSSGGSVSDARALAENLGIELLVIPIQPVFGAVTEQLAEYFEGMPEDTTEENIQPRLRAVILMALSNKFGHLLLTTGNKSELAVGYCTIYGDMAGGLAVISDVLKTRVYELSRWLNDVHAPRVGRKEIIPENTIRKPPSAELKPGQTDQDTLPPYEVLDEILTLYVENNITATDIIARGHDEKLVRWVSKRVDLNEYKRQQAAPGLKVTRLAFGVGRRMPIAQRFVD